MTRLEAARRQLDRFDQAAIRDGVENEPIICRFRALLAIRLINLTRSGDTHGPNPEA